MRLLPVLSVAYQCGACVVVPSLSRFCHRVVAKFTPSAGAGQRASACETHPLFFTFQVLMHLFAIQNAHLLGSRVTFCVSVTSGIQRNIWPRRAASMFTPTTTNKNTQLMQEITVPSFRLALRKGKNVPGSDLVIGRRIGSSLYTWNHIHELQPQSPQQQQQQNQSDQQQQQHTQDDQQHRFQTDLAIKASAASCSAFVSSFCCHHLPTAACHSRCAGSHAALPWA